MRAGFATLITHGAGELERGTEVLQRFLTFTLINIDRAYVIESGNLALGILDFPFDPKRLFEIVQRPLPITQRVVDSADIVQRACFSAPVAYGSIDRERLVIVVQRFLLLSR